MSFATISPTYNIPVRIYRIKSSQGLITKDMKPQLDHLFYENVGASSNPTNDINYPHSPYNYSDVDESLTRVNNDQLEKLTMNLKIFNNG